MVVTKLVNAFAVLWIGLNSAISVASGPPQVEFVLVSETPMCVSTSTVIPATLLLENNSTANEVQINGKNLSLSRTGKVTTIELNFDGVLSAVCRIQVPGKGTKFLAYPGGCYVYRLRDIAVDAEESPAAAAPQAGGDDAELEGQSGRFRRRLTGLKFLCDKWSEKVNDRRTQDEKVRGIRKDLMALRHRLESLRTLNVNLATVEHPGNRAALKVVNADLDQQIQNVTNGIHAAEKELDIEERKLEGASRETSALEQMISDTLEKLRKDHKPANQ